jgi:murein tripeptide amidase MpaA
MGTQNFLYGNNTSSDLSVFSAEISHALKTTGKMPEELEDLFEVVLVPDGNPDGTPRYMIKAK